MILETGNLSLTHGQEAKFEAAIREAVPLLLGSQRCREVRLHRVVEAPELYRLLVDWETPDEHTVHFRGSETLAKWRALVSPHVAALPSMTHSEEVLSSEIG